MLPQGGFKCCHREGLSAATGRVQVMPQGGFKCCHGEGLSAAMGRFKCL